MLKIVATTVVSSYCKCQIEVKKKIKKRRKKKIKPTIGSG